MPSNDAVQRFKDILANITRIEDFTKGLNAETFSKTEEAIYSVKYALLIISEAAQKLDTLATELCPGIPWREIRGLGNRLRHEYDLIDVARIWLVVEKDLPPLKQSVRSALLRLRESPAENP